MDSITSALVRPVVAADARSSLSTCSRGYVQDFLCPCSVRLMTSHSHRLRSAGGRPHRLAASPACHGAASTLQIWAQPPPPCLQTRCARSSPCGTASEPALQLVRCLVLCKSLASKRPHAGKFFLSDELTRWHFAEQNRAERQRLQVKRPSVAPQLPAAVQPAECSAASLQVRQVLAWGILHSSGLSISSSCIAAMLASVCGMIEAFACFLLALGST